MLSRGEHMHIKTIKGKKYYYESRRIGRRVTSIYIGPVEKMKRRDELDEENEQTTEEFYVG